MTNIDYAKYNNMTTKQLQKAYDNSLKKIANLESETKNFRNLVNFLSSKIQNNIANEYRSINQDEFVSLDEIPSYVKWRKEFESRPKEEQEALQKELDEIIANGGD